jgi:hypothetical protein
LFTAEYAEYAERFFIFYYKPFLLRDLCALCGAKNYSDISWEELVLGTNGGFRVSFFSQIPGTAHSP